MVNPRMDLMYSEDPKLFTLPMIRQIKRGNEIICSYRSFNPGYNNRHIKRNEFTKWKNESNTSSNSSKFTTQIKLRPYTDNEDGSMYCADFDEDYSVFQTKTKKYITKFHVPSYFYPAIVGSRGKTRDRIEKETLVNIKIPKHGETGEIVITGNTEHSVISARTRVNMIIIKKRDQHPVTHFISLPVISGTVKENFEIFKQSILKGPTARGIDESIFQNPNKLHMTIITLVLLDEVEVENALTVFYYAKDYVIDPILEKISNLKLKVQGIEIMNDDPSEVDVLYGRVELVNSEHDREFQNLVDGIVEYFARKGLARKQHDSVKLHVTLMNSLFRNLEVNTDGNDGSSRQPKRETFDASHVLQNFNDFYFGEIDAESLHFSIRFTTGEDLYYKPVSTISLKLDNQ